MWRFLTFFQGNVFIRSKQQKTTVIEKLSDGRLIYHEILQ